MAMQKKQNSFVQKFETELGAFCKRYGITEQSCIIVAFSGGADSLALLTALLDTGYKNIIAVYVNHHLRESKELDGEIELNSKNTKTLGVEFVVLDISSQRLNSLKQVAGIEGAARVLRYELLADFAKKKECEYILTAHNSTDCDEEDIIQFFRGADSFGSISEKIGNVYRPLLGFSHSDNEKYCNIKGLTYSQDTTNYDNKHLRSQIRMNLISSIEKVFPSFQKSFATRRKVAEQQQSLKSELFTALRAVNVRNSNNSRIGLKDISSIMDFFENGNNTGRMEYCDAVIFRAKKGDYILEKRGTFDFRWSCRITDNDIKSGRVSLDNFEQYVVFSIPSDTLMDDIESMPGDVVCLFCSGTIIFRSYEDNDFLTLAGKRTSIKSLLKSAGVSSNISKMVPVVEIGGNPVALLLGSVGCKNKFSDEYKSAFASSKSPKYLFIRVSSLLS